jgi:HNH endonuclease
MEKALQREVRCRAQFRCEYCHSPEEFAELPFHIDHVIAQQHGGRTTSDNLALACCYCNRYKGPNIAAIDPQTGVVVELFNPRRHAWEEHFSWIGSQLAPVARAHHRLRGFDGRTPFLAGCGAVAAASPCSDISDSIKLSSALEQIPSTVASSHPSAT